MLGCRHAFGAFGSPYDHVAAGRLGPDDRAKPFALQVANRQAANALGSDYSRSAECSVAPAIQNRNSAAPRDDKIPVVVKADVADFDVGQVSDARHRDNVRSHLAEIALAQEYPDLAGAGYDDVGQAIAINVGCLESHRAAADFQYRTGIKPAAIILV